MGAFMIGGIKKMTSQEIQQFVYDYLYNKGLPHKAIVAVMGNITGESSWSPDLIEVGSGVGYGLCQWSYTRRTQLEAYGTDLQHQCDFLWSELTGENTSATGADPQWINPPSSAVTGGESFSCSLSQFRSAIDTVEFLTKAFCYCWERPAFSTNHLDSIRIPSALDFNTTMTYQGGGSTPDYGAQVENAVQWMIDIANDDTHGYDQENRWSPDYDCSSFVISGYEQAGIPLKTNGATYTGDMKQVALDTGFHVVDWQNDQTKLVRGDILLNEIHHTAVYIGDGKVVQASQNELGTATGGQTGDQTGQEIYIRDYYVYSSGWDCVLRYHDGAGGGTNPEEGEVWTKIIATPYKVNQLSAEQTTFLKTLALNDSVKLKFTFNHNKRQIGQNYLGNKLTFDNKEYTIKDVRNDGYIIVSYGGSVYYKYVNPKYITSIS
jgi:cell wall-associated NlpC family hydrolase